MPLKSTPKIHSFPLWKAEDDQSLVDRYSSVPTAQDLRDGLLFGIPLVSRLTQQEIPEAQLDKLIKEAISKIEMKLDLYIRPVKFAERHDYGREFWEQSFAYLKLHHPNVIQIDSVELSFTNRESSDVDPVTTNQYGDQSKDNIPGWIQFPREHIAFSPHEATVQLVPAFGTTMSGFLMSAFSGLQYHALRTAVLGYFPLAVRVKYMAGFQDGHLPAAVAALIETTAACDILSIFGPLLFPYNSVSIGLDGLSQSTSNAGNNFLKQRLDELMRRRDELEDAVKGQFSRKFLVDFV